MKIDRQAAKLIAQELFALQLGKDDAESYARLTRREQIAADWKAFLKEAQRVEVRRRP